MDPPPAADCEYRIDQLVTVLTVVMVLRLTDPELVMRVDTARRAA